MDWQDHYNRYAWIYDFGLWLNGYKLAVAHAIKMLPFDEEDHFQVLDAGCGTGLYCLELLKQFPNAQIIAVDINGAMLQRLRSRLYKNKWHHQVQTDIVDLENLSSFDQKFDLIITGGVLEYVDIEKVVLSLSQQLKKRGYFLNSPVKNNIIGRAVGRCQGFKPYSLIDNIIPFCDDFNLIKRKSFPWYFPVSAVKEIHLFQKK